MAKKIVLVTVIVLVGVIYYFLYHDFFTEPGIQIHVSTRPKISFNPRRPKPGMTDQIVLISLGKEYKLTSLKVIPVEDIKTNKFPHAIWDLTSESNSAPVEGFPYGTKIHGMHATVKGLEPEPLVSGAEYRIMVEANKIKGQHDFKTPAAAATTE